MVWTARLRCLCFVHLQCIRLLSFFTFNFSLRSMSLWTWAWMMKGIRSFYIAKGHRRTIKKRHYLLGLAFFTFPFLSLLATNGSHSHRVGIHSTIASAVGVFSQNLCTQPIPYISTEAPKSPSYTQLFCHLARLPTFFCLDSPRLAFHFFLIQPRVLN